MCVCGTSEQTLNFFLKFRILITRQFHIKFLSLSQGDTAFHWTVSNEATSEMGYPVWPTGCTCDSISGSLKWHGAKPLSQEPQGGMLRG